MHSFELLRSTMYLVAYFLEIRSIYWSPFFYSLRTIRSVAFYIQRSSAQEITITLPTGTKQNLFLPLRYVRSHVQIKIVRRIESHVFISPTHRDLFTPTFRHAGLQPTLNRNNRSIFLFADFPLHPAFSAGRLAISCHKVHEKKSHRQDSWRVPRVFSARDRRALSVIAAFESSTGTDLSVSGR